MDPARGACGDDGAIVLVGCGGGDDEAAGELTPVTLQSKWVVQAHPFARTMSTSFRGWIYCRDNPTLGEGHQRWMMNEINDLIWPAPLGIGIMDPESFEITNQIATDYDIIQAPATEDTYRTDLAETAVAELEEDGEDVNGEDWEKPEVEVTPGGE